VMWIYSNINLLAIFLSQLGNFMQSMQTKMYVMCYIHAIDRSVYYFLVQEVSAVLLSFLLQGSDSTCTTLQIIVKMQCVVFL
jgi:hypothetical protein